MTQMHVSDLVKILVSVRDDATDDAYLTFFRFAFPRLADSKAQYLQDLWAAFMNQSQQDGFFVEFGAANGVSSSNTWYLEHKLGWRGILAEPARVWQPALRRNRSCSIDHRCVWSESGRTFSFVEPAIALHSTLEAFVEADDLADTRRDGQRYEVETVSLDDLLVHWNAPRRIDYLSVDTEGSELDILAAFDFERWDVRLITVEHNNTDKREGLHQLLTAKGYKRVFNAMSQVDDWYRKLT